MQDTPETPDERLQRRRIRRWKRRARLVGPFLGIPLLLATLSLSVDLIEYKPQPKPDRLSDRPVRMTQATTVDSIWPDRLSASEAESTLPNAPDEATKAEDQSDGPDVLLPLPAVPKPPTPPYALNRR